MALVRIASRHGSLAFATTEGSQRTVTTETVCPKRIDPVIFGRLLILYRTLSAGRFGLDCLANLDALPPTGALLMFAPPKIARGSGSPLLALALVGA